MEFKPERNLLRCLCKGHIGDLIDEVGWNKVQCQMVTKKYIEFKTKAKACMEIGLSETQYTRELNNLLAKLQSYVIHNRNAEITEFYHKCQNSN